MIGSAYAVGIVVDPDFGERLRTVAERIHEWCLEILPVVVEHHGDHSHEPPVSVLEIHGTELTPKLAEGLTALGFEDAEATAIGLMARLRRGR